MDRNTGMAPYTSRPKLLMEHLENNGERVCSARARAAKNVWLVWRGALVQVDESRRYSRSFLNTAGGLPSSEEGAKAYTKHNDCVARAG